MCSSYYKRSSPNFCEGGFQRELPAVNDVEKSNRSIGIDFLLYFEVCSYKYLYFGKDKSVSNGIMVMHTNKNNNSLLNGIQ